MTGKAACEADKWSLLDLLFILSLVVIVVDVVVVVVVARWQSNVESM